MQLENIIWRNKNRWEYDLDKLKSFVSEESKKYTCKKELCKAMGVYKDFLDNVQKKEKIEFEYNFIVLSNNTKYKAVYQDYDWCYQKYVIERKTYQEMADELGVTKRVIQKWCVEKHGLHSHTIRKHLKLNDLQRRLIIISTLGDGHIDKRNKQPMFIVSHAENQKDYLYWKYEILKDLCNKEPSVGQGKAKDFNGKKYNCQKYYRLNTKVIDELHEIKNMKKRDIIKGIDEFQLSVFMLDDGHRGDSCWSLCVAMFSEDEKQLLVNELKSKFTIDCHICLSDNRYINFTSHSTKKIDEMILKNIPNELDVVKYKILENNKLSKYVGYLYVILNNGKEVGLSNYKGISKNSLLYKRTREYLMNNEIYKITEDDLIKLLDEIN